ncbi:MAG: hypothetical protein FD181_1330 [Prolixibacteraceae bacterium]|nr:MAG: hypothetical protein FD181_1330 [Prolixibacteraceae bacterium]
MFCNYFVIQKYQKTHTINLILSTNFIKKKDAIRVCINSYGWHPFNTNAVKLLLHPKLINTNRIIFFPRIQNG